MGRGLKAPAAGRERPEGAGIHSVLRVLGTLFFRRRVIYCPNCPNIFTRMLLTNTFYPDKINTMTNSCTAFSGLNRIATGERTTVALAAKSTLDSDPTASILIFDDATGQQVELDLRGSVDEILARLAPPPAPPVTAGRPKLGVVPREVTLLPRHWEWLATQPGGASVALRKLVEEARKANAWQDALRQRQEITYRFLSAIAGNLPAFEEATRALFAGNAEALAQQMEQWPPDIREHALMLLAGD